MIRPMRGHLLHIVHKQQRRVVRTTFTTELLGGCDTQDGGYPLAVILHEMKTSNISAANFVSFRENSVFWNAHCAVPNRNECLRSRDCIIHQDPS